MTNEELLPKRQYIAIADVGDSELSIAITTNPDEHRRMVKEYTDGNVEFTYIPASSLLKKPTNTDQELLQQAKDQVAMTANYKGCTDWDSFKSRMNNDGYEMQPYHDDAAIIAIQKAREEASPKWIFTSYSIPEPAIEDPDNSYYVLGSKGWSYAPLVVYYSYISREFMSRETNAPVKGILFWTTLPDQPEINDKRN